jgi:hypothetical protein
VAMDKVLRSFFEQGMTLKDQRAESSVVFSDLCKICPCQLLHS